MQVRILPVAPKQMKNCTKCKITKELSEYYTKGRKVDGKLQSECKVCFNIRMRSKYEKYKDLMIKLKGGMCCVCGYNKCIAALEFHHLESEDKDFNVSKAYSYSESKLLSEVEKCQLLCSNCHREVHYNQTRSSAVE